MLIDYVGTDLSRLYNEIDKLMTALGAGATVTAEAVERNIGMSKDYNNFELVDALAVKDSGKVFRIADYFRSNPKNNPLVVSASTIFSFLPICLPLTTVLTKAITALWPNSSSVGQGRSSATAPPCSAITPFRSLRLSQPSADTMP